MTDNPGGSPQQIVRRVLKSLEGELRRQASEGRLQVKGPAGMDGLIEIEGYLDLASFAAATEIALRQEFSL